MALIFAFGFEKKLFPLVNNLQNATNFNVAIFGLKNSF